jgi:hypothetical protein
MANTYTINLNDNQDKGLKFAMQNYNLSNKTALTKAQYLQYFCEQTCGSQYNQYTQNLIAKIKDAILSAVSTSDLVTLNKVKNDLGITD